MRVTRETDIGDARGAALLGGVIDLQHLLTHNVANSVNPSSGGKTTGPNIAEQSEGFYQEVTAPQEVPHHSGSAPGVGG